MGTKRKGREEGLREPKGRGWGKTAEGGWRGTKQKGRGQLDLKEQGPIAGNEGIKL